MKTTASDNLRPVIIKVDKSLNKYANQGYFKEKIDEAKSTLKKVGLPKELKH